MAKRVPMTRERQQALPTILAAAREATKHVPMSDKELAKLETALAAFQ